jgi:hypothetical protein
MKKPLLRITAKHKITHKSVEMEYYSVKQAWFFNKDFEDFRIIGYAKKGKQK